MWMSRRCSTNNYVYIYVKKKAYGDYARLRGKVVREEWVYEIKRFMVVNQWNETFS